MEWIEYKLRFLEEAQKHKKSAKYCNECLDYAEKLWNKQLPIIYTQDHLCAILGYLPEYVYAASNNPAKFYRCYTIPKKNGGKRTISEPLPNLKDIQRWILDQILYQFDVSPYAKAYIKGKSIKDNVRFHRRQKKVLSLDIKDFYTNLTDWMVYQLFIKAGYHTDVSMMLTSLCCLDSSLPQGAPTSAALSNILMKEFDYEVGAFCQNSKIRFTRYADDMTFSGDFDEMVVISFVRNSLKKLHLNLNTEKTRVRKQGQQQEVTGIVVNYKPQLSKHVRKDIRQSMYYIKKYGLQSHLDYIQEERNNYLQHLLGIITYALFINPHDQELRKYKQYLLQLIQ